MKKILSVLCVSAMVFLMPFVVKAASTTHEVPAYGTVTIDETPWTQESGVVTQVYSITKSGPFVAITIIPTRNVSNVRILDSSSFSIVKNINNEDGSVTVLLKANNGTGASGKTELMTVVADGGGTIATEGCVLDFSPINLNCSTEIEGFHFDNNGNSITEEEFEEACSGKTPPTGTDVPNSPDTGSVIPYIAIGGGLIAVAGVYLYSRKANKVYKI